MEQYKVIGSSQNQEIYTNITNEYILTTDNTAKASNLLKLLERDSEKEIGLNSYGVRFCPSCNGSIWQVKPESNYCFRCGQKLKW